MSFFSNISPRLGQALLQQYGSGNLQFPMGDEPDLLMENLLVFYHFYKPELCVESNIALR